QDRPDARRLPRQLQIQPSRQECARVQCRGAAVRAMGRSRSHERLVPGRGARLERLRRQEHTQIGRARMPRLPRIHADAGDAGRSWPHLSQDPLWPAARRLPARYALLPHALWRNRRPCRNPGADAVSWLKRELMSSQATWKIIAADLPIGVVSGDAIAQGDGTPRGREIEIADLLAFIKH